jgi:hypothetical protein
VWEKIQTEVESMTAIIKSRSGEKPENEKPVKKRKMLHDSDDEIHQLLWKGEK